jgi:hypothetical protein
MELAKRPGGREENVSADKSFQKLRLSLPGLGLCDRFGRLRVLREDLG